MWCPSCRAEVAAELSTDNRRMLCARCQTELGITAAAASQIANLPRTVETERDARELLARWSAQSLLDAPAPAVGAGPFAKPNGPVDLPVLKPDLRFDPPRAEVPRPSVPYLDAARARSEFPSIDSHDQSENNQSGQPERPRKQKSRAARLAAAGVPENSHATPASNPAPVAEPHPQHHSETTAQFAQAHPHRQFQTTMKMMAGQICAYAGVALLTCGTVMVMWNYFGGPARFLPMGWLTAAVGQMLLFLGVVTLMSSGMDQTIHEVGWRIDFLADEIHHMELALSELEQEHRKDRRGRSGTPDRTSDAGPSQEAA